MSNSSLVMTVQISLRGTPSLLHFAALSVTGAGWLLRIEVSASCTRVLWASWVVVPQEENVGKLYPDRLISPQLNPPLGCFEEISQIFRWIFSISQFTHPSASWEFVSYSLTGWATILREAIFPAASHILWLRSSSAPKRRTMNHVTLTSFQCGFWFYCYGFIQYYQAMTPISHGAQSFNDSVWPHPACHK